MKDHYKTLGVSPAAPTEEIKKAYFALAKKVHPDSGKTADTKMFHELSEAYAVLSDDEKRKDYNLSLPVVPSHAPDSVRGKAIYRTPEDHKGHEVSKRHKELAEFERSQFRVAVLRVAAFTVLSGLVGFLLAAVMEIPQILMTLAAMGIGFSMASSKNFDLRSFNLQWPARLLFILSLGILAVLILK